MKKFFVILSLIVGLFGISSLSFAGGVTDNNDGNKGYVLVSTGENNGANSVGTWTDASFLKGDKGDTGATGQQGIQGVAGQDGQNGSNGVDGKDGDKGDKGDAGLDGQNGKDGKTPIKGVDYNDGINGVNGENGTNGKDVDPSTVNRIDNRLNNQQNQIDGLNNRVGTLEKTQYVITPEVRIFDSRKWQVRTGISINPQRKMVDRVETTIMFKMGRSYEEKRLDELERKLNVANENSIPNNAEMYTTGSKIGIHEKF
jgi:hypothetical protein